MSLQLASATPLQANSSKRPNIVLILADDLGYGDLGCYGNRVNKTPHIDALAAGGIRFTDFHSAGAMCSPTRAATLTGQYQQRLGRRFDSALSGVRDRQHGLPHDTITIAELLKAESYATGCFGKWHLGYEPPWLPTRHGFDEFRGLGSGDGDFHTHVDRSGNEDWWHDNRIEMEPGYTTDLLTRHSIDFIRRHREQPFFLYVPHLAIHFPWQGPDDPPHRQAGMSYHDDKWGIIPDKRNVSPHVRAMIHSLDESVGTTMAALSQWGLTENTIVLFSSDNGGYLTYGKDFHNISSNGALRGQKGGLYEGGHRVPMIISWPGKFEPAVSDATAHSTDLLPTFASLAGVASDSMETDGIDLEPLLLRGQHLPNRMLFWRAGSQRAVRSGPWKLHAGKQPELYNLSSDLGEQRNIADAHPAIVRRLLDAWGEWETDVNESAKRFQ